MQFSLLKIKYFLLSKLNISDDTRWKISKEIKDKNTKEILSRKFFIQRENSN